VVLDEVDDDAGVGEGQDVAAKVIT